jgi:hypothetical protein
MRCRQGALFFHGRHDLSVNDKGRRGVVSGAKRGQVAFDGAVVSKDLHRHAPKMRGRPARQCNIGPYPAYAMWALLLVASASSGARRLGQDHGQRVEDAGCREQEGGAVGDERRPEADQQEERHRGAARQGRDNRTCPARRARAGARRASVDRARHRGSCLARACVAVITPRLRDRPAHLPRCGRPLSRSGRGGARPHRSHTRAARTASRAGPSSCRGRGSRSPDGQWRPVRRPGACRGRTRVRSASARRPRDAGGSPALRPRRRQRGRARWRQCCTGHLPAGLSAISPLFRFAARRKYRTASCWSLSTSSRPGGGSLMCPPYESSRTTFGRSHPRQVASHEAPGILVPGAFAQKLNWAPTPTNCTRCL